MTINRIRKKRNNQFTQISNNFLEDNRISFKSKGIFIYLWSKPDGWKIVIKDISNHGKENESAIRSAFHELREYGYMDWQAVQGGWDYFINDEANINFIKPKKGDQKPKTPKKPQFTKPTLEEIKEYNNSRGGCVDAKKFYDYYEAGNWKDQKGNKIKNWKQKLITWENKVNKNNTESNREQHTADLINKMCNDTLIKKISLKSDKILNFHTTKENKEKLQNLPENQKQEIKSILKDNFGEKTIEFIY